jgi:hypothetical protein
MISEYLAYRYGRSVGHGCDCCCNHCWRKYHPISSRQAAVNRLVAFLLILIAVIVLAAGVFGQAPT